MWYKNGKPVENPFKIEKDGKTKYVMIPVNEFYNKNNTFFQNNGCEWIEPIIPEEPSTEEFDRACEYFRQICGEIGDLMGVENFRGGYDDMPVFYAHDAYKTDKGMQLAIAWSGCNDFCNHEAAKLGLGSPEWWYKCWNIEQQ